MIHQRIHGVRIMMLWLTAGAAMALFALWYLVVFGVLQGNLPSPVRYFLYAIVIGLAVLLERLFRERSISLAPAAKSADRSIYVSFRQTIFAFAAVAVYTFLAKDSIPSRAFFISFFAFLPGAMLAVNHYLTPAITRRIFRGNRRIPTILVGDPALVRKHLAWFRDRHEHGLRTVGYIGNGPRSSSIDGVPQLGSADRLAEALRDHRPGLAVFLESPGHPDDLIARKQLGDMLGIRVLHIWDFEAALGVVPTITVEDGLHFLGFRSEPLESPANRLTKRAFDIALSLPVCLFLLPFLAVAVKIAQFGQSRGPLLFIQDRQGVNGTRFRMFKFRTMHPNNPDAARQASRGDDRIYPVGRILRKLSLDEFPQFFNVLLGDMSIVGPRPHMPEPDAQFADRFAGYPVRAFVKPGIPGLAQVRGFRGVIETDEDIRNRAESDLFYIENWSLSLDASIVLRTATGLLIPARNAV